MRNESEEKKEKIKRKQTRTEKRNYKVKATK